jgi:hypothetical protein
MTRPNIQIDDLVREMTEEEYAELLASGWTEAPAVEENATQEEVAIVEEPVDDLVEGEQL